MAEDDKVYYNATIYLYNNNYITNNSNNNSSSTSIINNSVNNFSAFGNNNVINGNQTIYGDDIVLNDEELNNWWALSAIGLAVGTAAGNILVCLAICWERRLQNVTNYFLMSLAITDLMVAILVMPLGILTLVRGKF